MIVVRLCKISLLTAIAFFFTFVVFNNITDFDSNYQFVQHVLMMDSTFPGNHGCGAPSTNLGFRCRSFSGS
jgi:predicted small integral membrane protein